MQWHTGCSEWHCSCAGSFIQLQGFDLMSNGLPTERHSGVLSKTTASSSTLLRISFDE